MKSKMLIEEIDSLIATANITSCVISSPDALAVVFVRKLLKAMKEYHEGLIKEFNFDRKLSFKLDNIEKFIEILKGAKTPK